MSLFRDDICNLAVSLSYEIVTGRSFSSLDAVIYICMYAYICVCVYNAVMIFWWFFGFDSPAPCFLHLVH